MIMNRYLYSLRNYHAIRNAEIAVDGLTVLAGINGCGKSTLSKWLYYLVNGVNGLERYLYQEYLNDIQELVRGFDMARRGMDRDVDAGSLTYFRQAQVRIRRFRYGETEGTEGRDEVLELFTQVLTRFCEMLKAYLKGPSSFVRKERVLNYLAIWLTEEELTDEDHIERIVDDFYHGSMQEARDLRNRYRQTLENRTSESFFSLVSHRFGIRDKRPDDIQLEEDGVGLFHEGTVGSLYGLERAIYVDTPMAVSEENDSENPFWSDLQDILLRESVDGQTGSDAVRKITLRIRKLLGGDVRVEDNDFDQKELHYVRQDGLNIRLEDTATGFKSFSYILRLLDNGYINSRTLLLIDEPEAHLHPQWIVEFAHILVLLNKNVGVKVMVASHNPDMVAAIQAIACKEELLDRTRFYLAMPSDNGLTYDYKDLGQNIEEIFKSFNMAYRKIEQYGKPGL